MCAVQAGADRDFSPEVACAVNLAPDELLTNTIGYDYKDEERHRRKQTPMPRSITAA